MTLCVARSTCIRTVCERNHLWYIPRGQTRSGMVEMRIRQLKEAPQLVLLEMESSAALLSVCGRKGTSRLHFSRFGERMCTKLKQRKQAMKAWACTKLKPTNVSFDRIQYLTYLHCSQSQKRDKRYTEHDLLDLISPRMAT